ncbi:hypothetical protein F4827_006454 [Paraburkholderia bannensis]|uniref:Uncharacterized protein n=1 Tax=Paraburkholderia bannensis TaxID=765414 RepID=A0A7W9U3W9_9BURK|nr:MULTISPECIES: hypothetical protein [Paraburkholderia]MBB3261522.1 hypothetical protein [Paraburkholderia sp. WP4_3_2]MBB6106578.1 hypothetical protein [Paraburkholderia bannensis]
MAYPVLFRAILVSIVVLAGVVILFAPSPDPVIARRRAVLRISGVAIVALAMALLAVVALLAPG